MTTCALRRTAVTVASIAAVDIAVGCPPTLSSPEIEGDCS